MANPKEELACTAPYLAGNRFDSREWAGAFGDLGTLIPFVMAYVTLLGMDPFGVLFAFGMAKIACGLYYRTPFPVQPMKASGVIATTGAPAVVPDMVYGAGLATGALWLILGLSGALTQIARLVGKPVATGIILGLGISFMLQGAGMMAHHWQVAGLAFLGAAVLLVCKRSMAMLFLLGLGAAVAAYQAPSILTDLGGVQLKLHLPQWQLGQMTASELLVGALLIGLPQVPLTLSNAVIAVTAENNTLFPDRPVDEKTVAMSTGLMNGIAPLIGGVPMCHGAGGMAGHLAFGARTGGSMIILGSILLFLALFLADSMQLLFRFFPAPVLGVIILIAGWQLVRGCRIPWPGPGSESNKEWIVMLVTAFLSAWNIAVAFITGIALFHLFKREFGQNRRQGRSQSGSRPD